MIRLSKPWFVVLASVLVSIGGSHASATEPTVPIDLMLRKLVQGPVEEARKELESHLEQNLKELETFAERPQVRDLELFYSVNSSAWLGEQLEKWEEIEVDLQRRGGEIPNDVKRQMMDFSIRVERVFRRLEGRLQSQGPGRARPEEVALGLRNAHRTIGDVLLKTALVVEGAADGKERENLLNLARGLTEAPATLQKLEAQSEVLFPPLGQELDSASMAASASPRLEATAGMRDLVDRFYRAFFAGDLATAQRLLSPDTAIRVDLHAFYEELRGGTYLGFGRLEVREGAQKDRSELRVWVVDLKLTDASGNERITRNGLVLERIGDRYRIKEF